MINQNIHFDEFDDDDNAPQVSLIIPAAGESSRMEMSTRKPWIPLGGMPIIIRTLAVFRQISWIKEVILVVNQDDEKDARDMLWNDLREHGVSMIVTGAENRAMSVYNGLQVTDPANDVVAVHDAVRPFITVDTCKALMRLASKTGAAIPVTPVTDTIKRVEGDKVIDTPQRIGMMSVQTPQCFRREVLVEAYEFALKTGGITDNITDDASLVEQYGQEVSVILSNSTNIKITCKEDLVLAESLLKTGIV